MNKADVLISVIVPVYNTERYINQCVDSILKQTYSSLEIILINGGSTDDTGRICDEYKEKDCRIKVIHKLDNGVTSDRKAGIKESTGDYIAFVDGDDWLSEDMYHVLLQKAIETDADIVTSGVIRDFPGSSRTNYDGLNDGVYSCDKDGFLQNNMIWMDNTSNKGILPGLWNKVFKRSVIYSNLLEMDDLITHNEDEALFIAAVLDSMSVAVVHDAFYHYRAWNGASSNRQDELFFTRFNQWMLYLRRKLNSKSHAIKLEKDIDRLALDQIVWGMETQFKFMGKNTFPRFVVDGDKLPDGNMVLYGAGLVGRSYYKQLMNGNKHRVVAWVDKASEMYADEVKDVNVIGNISYDYVLIAVKSVNSANEIKEELIRMGVHESKILWYEPMYVMDYVFGKE